MSKLKSKRLIVMMFERFRGNKPIVLISARIHPGGWMIVELMMFRNAKFSYNEWNDKVFIGQVSINFSVNKTLTDKMLELTSSGNTSFLN